MPQLLTNSDLVSIDFGCSALGRTGQDQLQHRTTHRTTRSRCAPFRPS